MLSKALTACPKVQYQHTPYHPVRDINIFKDIRIHATKLLRKYATREVPLNGQVTGSDVAYWAIRLLVTQLYDPAMEVSEIAVQILQEACNRKQYLEYVVKCRPALDHLGEIGAPLLLRYIQFMQPDIII